jgi:ANTAR domain
MTARRASAMQIERLTFSWTPLDECADPPTGPDSVTEIAQLRAALAHRDTIGMAKGLLMERYGVDADAAFEMLRRTSQCSNTKLATLAAEMVARHSRLRRAIGAEARRVLGRAAALSPEQLPSTTARRHSGTATDGERSEPVRSHDDVPESRCGPE